MSTEQHYHYTPQEYLVLEAKADYKSEYHQGQILAMAGGSFNHNRIIGNVYANLYNALETSNCQVLMSDLRLWIEKKRLYTYPDITVICGEPEFIEDRTDTITNPKTIIEVLSKSTESYDRSDKFYAYSTLDTFEEYVLIDQYKVRVEYFRRVDEKMWEINVLTKIDMVLKSKSLDVEIPLDKIYRNVKWLE